MTAFVLALAGRVPPLDQRIRDQIRHDDVTIELARRLAHEPFVQSITLSNADDPQLDEPTVLVFSAESWAHSRSALDVVPPGERARQAALWHTAVPLADGGYLLTPDPDRPDAVSFYRATRDDRREAFQFRAGTVFRRGYNEIVWQERDDRCHLIRYFSGILECHRVECDDDCNGAIQVDPNTGAQSLPCGCP
ncbi:hypothetical protein [Mycobacterium sp.]|jgi:hypothetical protein|uniref:hypothetical protein n=1 Tax=Mycobacterium sp. TaxID=1785 RepID=UPI003BAF4095